MDNNGMNFGVSGGQKDELDFRLKKLAQQEMRIIKKEYQNIAIVNRVVMDNEMSIDRATSDILNQDMMDIMANNPSYAQIGVVILDNSDYKADDDVIQCALGIGTDFFGGYDKGLSAYIVAGASNVTLEEVNWRAVKHTKAKNNTPIWDSAIDDMGYDYWELQCSDKHRSPADIIRDKLEVDYNWISLETLATEEGSYEQFESEQDDCAYITQRNTDYTHRDCEIMLSDIQIY